MQGLSRLDRRLCHRWPRGPAQVDPDQARVGIVIASFNTYEVLALSLFTLFRILRDQRIVRVVVVDNGSTDGSRELLQALASADPVDAIFNRRQRYHGPALNQGVEFLRRQHVRKDGQRQPIDYIWVLDSDALVLRHDALDDVLARMAECDACLAGEYLPRELASGIDGYAHPSSLVFEPAKVWRRSVGAFDRSGAPGMAMQHGLIRMGYRRCDFPFMADRYVLHLGASTLRSIWENGHDDNAFFQWAEKKHTPHFHGNPDGEQILAELVALFEHEGAGESPQALLNSLTTGDRIDLKNRRCPSGAQNE